jgi:hypothetical protein
MNGADANKRAKKLWETVKAGLQLPSHLRVTTNDNVNGNKNAEKGPGMDCFDDVQNFLCDMLQAENQRAFLVSKEYQDFLANAPDDYKLDSVVLTLKDFKEDRQLEKTKDDFVTDLNMLLRLENVLEDPLLTAYFRRFLRISFQEENYLFFQDVQDMKVQHYIKAASTEISPDMSLGEILEVTAVKIFDKFIKAGAMFQVNISADVREEVVRMVENNEITANMYVRGAVRCGAVRAKRAASEAGAERSGRRAKRAPSEAGAERSGRRATRAPSEASAERSEREKELLNCRRQQPTPTRERSGAAERSGAGARIISFSLCVC